MLGALTVVLVVALSVLITRVATVALTLTGLSRESARFQARSALSGAGFTTSESEQIVNHPVRRRIIMTLMLMGSAGVVTVIATAAVSFSGIESGRELGQSALTLVVGLGLLLWASTSRAVDRALQPVIHRLLRRYTDIDTRDYARLLHVAGDYSVMEMVVERSDWMCDRDLAELRLSDEGVLVLGIQRADAGAYVGAPKGWTTIHAGDVMILYGEDERLAELDVRKAGLFGEAAHQQAVQEQAEVYAADREAEEAAAAEAAEHAPESAEPKDGTEPPPRPAEPAETRDAQA